MQFKYNSFNVECSVSETAGRYLGQATISRPPSLGLEGSGVKSGYLRSFDSEAQALGFARFWAEKWCDTH
jgi:hypothetical protein